MFNLSRKVGVAERPWMHRATADAIGASGALFSHSVDGGEIFQDA
jgi:hypothetical protein